jgi:hypothetical protein
MSAKKHDVIITSGALEDSPDGRIILRGVIDAANLRKLGVGDYQKKTHSQSKLRRLGHAVKEGSRLPDIELGMRGQNFDSTGNTYVLHDPCYIIDGLQRKMALCATDVRYPEVNCSVGAIINFSTTEKWERQRFEKLATDRTAVAPSVLLRNFAKDDKIAKMVLDLTQDPDSILYRRVTWDQHMLSGELVYGSTLYHIIILLHSWKIAPGSRKAYAMIGQVNEIAENIGDAVMLSNTRKFFELADHFWGFKEVQKRDGVIHVSAEFLFVMAELMATMSIFWDGSSLDDSLKVRRLKTKLQISPKLKDWLKPSRGARDHVLVYYKRELNKNRSIPFAERPTRARRPKEEKAA